MIHLREFLRRIAMIDLANEKQTIMICSHQHILSDSLHCF